MAHGSCARILGMPCVALHTHAFQRRYGGARVDAEAVGATTLGATHLGLEHKLELRAVDNLEPLDVAAMQRGVLIAVDVGVEERVTLDVHLAV